MPHKSCKGKELLEDGDSLYAKNIQANTLTMPGSTSLSWGPIDFYIV